MIEHKCQLGLHINHERVKILKQNSSVTIAVFDNDRLRQFEQDVILNSYCPICGANLKLGLLKNPSFLVLSNKAFHQGRESYTFCFLENPTATLICQFIKNNQKPFLTMQFQQHEYKIKFYPRNRQLTFEDLPNPPSILKKDEFRINLYPSKATNSLINTNDPYILNIKKLTPLPECQFNYYYIDCFN